MLVRIKTGTAAAVWALAIIATLHVGSADLPASRSYLLVWAGDRTAADTTSGDAARGSIPGGSDGAPGPDFLAVIDADPASPGYGKVVSTLTVPGVANEPHHMQYVWRPGDPVYAGGLFSDRTFVFDVSDAPNVTLRSVVEPLDTPCGSVPDAYWVLSDGSALGTYMGGPNAAGDPRCNGGINNGFAGTPGTLVRISPAGVVLGEFPAAGDPAAPSAADSRADACLSNPPLARPSCANPHGIAAREDLGIAITSDYAEPRNVPTNPVPPISENVFRDTVRVWDISNLDEIKVRSVSVLPVGSRNQFPSPMVDPRGAMGIMETTLTNLPGHRGAFASSMCGGQIYYTGDVTAAQPYWVQVFDAAAAAIEADSAYRERAGGCVGAGWLATSPDDTLLFQAAIGRDPRTLAVADPGVPKMVYAIDIRSLVAIPAAEWRPDNPAICRMDDLGDVFEGGDEPSCPKVAGAITVPDETTGGPHWGAYDPFTLSSAPGRVSAVTRIAVSNYFVARSGTDGNHTVCMLSLGASGSLTLDSSFRDEVTGAPCVDFDRAVWPHGAHGPAKPHSMLFVTPS